MGKGYIYTCEKCGKEYRFYFGCGMFGFREEQLLDLKRPVGGILEICHEAEEKNIVRELIKSKKYHLVEGYGYKVCKCDECGQFYNKFTFELFSREDKDGYISKVICKKCNKKLRILKAEDIKGENIPGKCTECGNMKFDFGFFNWD